MNNDRSFLVDKPTDRELVYLGLGEEILLKANATSSMTFRFSVGLYRDIYKKSILENIPLFKRIEEEVVLDIKANLGYNDFESIKSLGSYHVNEYDKIIQDEQISVSLRFASVRNRYWRALVKQRGEPFCYACNRIAYRYLIREKPLNIRVGEAF